MAAPVTVTADEIGRAGETLLEENRPVTGYSLRMRLGNRGDPKRLLAIWGEVRRGIAETADQPPEAAIAPLPPDLAAQAAALGEQFAVEIRAAIAAAWAMAERRAAERLGGEVAAARAAADASSLGPDVTVPPPASDGSNARRIDIIPRRNGLAYSLGQPRIQRCQIYPPADDRHER
jgi:hypothetical protein